jgi:hypothetical protein
MVAAQGVFLFFIALKRKKRTDNFVYDYTFRHL